MAGTDIGNSFTVRRLAWFVPIMLLVGTITFVVTSLLPGDPAAVMLGSEATPAQVHELRQAMGLDRPLPVRYRDWLWGAARLDFGDSIFLDRPVSEAIGDRIVPTAQLTLYSLVIALGLGLPAGVIAALYRNSILDRLLMLAAVSGIAIARFFLGIVLILVFAVHLGWLPAGGYQPLSNGLLPHFRSMVMPAVAVSVSVAGLLARLTRSSMLQALGGDYVRTALASGLSRPHIVVGHTFKNALAPTIAVLGVVLGDLLVGAVIVETVFGLPGMGQLVANSIARRDLPVLQGVVMVATLVTLSTSLLVDVVSEAIDPRIRSDRR